LVICAIIVKNLKGLKLNNFKFLKMARKLFYETQQLKSVLLILLLFFLLHSLFSCSNNSPPYFALPMNWQPIDSLNKNLPPGICVVAGRNDSLPLRAWYVYVEEPRPEIITRNDSLFRWPNPPQHRPGKPAEVLDYSQAKHIKLCDAVGAGPMLIGDGNIRITSDEEIFFGTSIPKVHPRSAAGITKDGSLILMVVDGRQPESRGVSLAELATLMQEAGAVQAINLDGGGSSTLVVNNVLVNRPAGKTIQRQVMSALAVFYTP
jgi:hypothetical protein